MDFETMMGPIIYQDIPSTFGMKPMPEIYPMGNYYTTGINQIKPELEADKFEKKEQKDKTSKHTFRNIMIALGSGALIVGAVVFGKKGFKKLFPNGFKAGMQNVWHKVKNSWETCCTKVKELFKGKTQPANNTSATPTTT